MKRLAIAIAIIIAVTFGSVVLVQNEIINDQAKEWVHTIECDGTRVTLHDMSMREAASWGVDHCENMTVLP